MERISHDGKGYLLFLKSFQQPPEIRVQNGISPRQVEVRLTAKVPAKILAVFQHCLHIFPRHAVDTFLLAFRKNIAVLATLVAVIGDMPLE